MGNYREAFDLGSVICAPATATGMSAIAIIRISGEGCIDLCSRLIKPVKKGIFLNDFAHGAMHLSVFRKDDEIVDEIMVARFNAPHSYTGEDMIEIFCHGSSYIENRIIEILVSEGARFARPGEFTMRAFLNGRLDLSQAEAVADLIASGSRAAHDIAFSQMRGGFSSRIQELRKQLLNFSSLIELELDFSEEDVEFADRPDLIKLLVDIRDEVEKLITSFSLGNVIKTGIPVAIIGKPNVGKSTLLNALLNEERALVSEIPGTTRDTIEDVINIGGVSFRFIDTAGLRHATETIENMGIERTWEKIRQAMVILLVFDINETTVDEIKEEVENIKSHISGQEKRIIVIANKTDSLIEMPRGFRDLVDLETIFISAKRKENISLISESILRSASTGKLEDGAIVSNARHLDALTRVLEMISAIEKGISEDLPTDLVAEDLRMALYHLGTITGEITNEELLDNIFGNFCIGK